MTTSYDSLVPCVPSSSFHFCSRTSPRTNFNLQIRKLPSHFLVHLFNCSNNGDSKLIKRMVTCHQNVSIPLSAYMQIDSVIQGHPLGKQEKGKKSHILRVRMSNKELQISVFLLQRNALIYMLFIFSAYFN